MAGMKIEETKEVVRKTVERVVVGRKCDVCGREILKKNGQYNYFLITTHHSDWGSESFESYEYFDACDPCCADLFMRKYINEAYQNAHNTKAIEIKHVSTLDGGAD